jgi:phosphoethanolamine N-methyltransferase
MNATKGEYVEAHFVGQEIIWGEGYMSPGGDDEVASVVDGVDIRGKRVLEIGSGLGGSAVALVANHDPGRVISIDIQLEQIERATRLAEKRGLSDRVEFRIVDPGPLPFVDESFDVVFSMGTFVQIRDKPMLLAEIFRVLRRGGALAANDWLRGRPFPLSEELENYMERVGLAYHWATPEETCDALASARFVDIALRDRAEWFADLLGEEITKLQSGPMRADMIEAFDEESTEGWLWSWRQLKSFADQREICPTQITAVKAG